MDLDAVRTFVAAADTSRPALTALRTHRVATRVDHGPHVDPAVDPAVDTARGRGGAVSRST